MENLLCLAVMVFFAILERAFVNLSPLPPCQEPGNIDELFKNLTNQGNMDFILPPGMESGGNVIPSSNEEQYLYGNKECPFGQKYVQVGSNTPLSARSICPFYFVTTHDARRYPASITEARCSCKDCMDYDKPSPRNRCEPVKRSIKVIVKHECVNNVWQYRMGTYLKQESCTCALPTEVENGQPISGDGGGSADSGNNGSESAGPEPM